MPCTAPVAVAVALGLAGCGRIGVSAVEDGGTPDGAPDGVQPGRWRVVQTVADLNGRLAVSALGAHHLIIVAVNLDSSGSITAVMDNAGCNSYTAIPGARAQQIALADDLQIFFVSDSCPGASEIAITATSHIFAAAAWEVDGIRTDAPLDAASAASDQPASSAPLGPSITTSVAGAFVVSVAIVENTATRVHTGNPFTNDHGTNGDAWAHLTDPMAPAGTYQAQWDQPARGRYSASAAAFRVAP